MFKTNRLYFIAFKICFRWLKWSIIKLNWYVVVPGFEQFLYGSQNSTNEPKFKDKLSEDDITDVKDAIQEGMAWLNTNSEASVEDITAKQRDIEGRVHPILAKAYQDAVDADADQNDAPTDEANEDSEED